MHDVWIGSWGSRRPGLEGLAGGGGPVREHGRRGGLARRRGAACLLAGRVVRRVVRRRLHAPAVERVDRAAGDGDRPRRREDEADERDRAVEQLGDDER
eukprot:6963066-Prymnesium_polylepis.1